MFFEGPNCMLGVVSRRYGDQHESSQTQQTWRVLWIVAKNQKISSKEKRLKSTRKKSECQASCSWVLSTSSPGPSAWVPWGLGWSFIWSSTFKIPHSFQEERGDWDWPRTESIHINCKRVYTIVWHFEIARFSCFSTGEKRMVAPLPSLRELLPISYY